MAVRIGFQGVTLILFKHLGLEDSPEVRLGKLLLALLLRTQDGEVVVQDVGLE